MKRLLTFRILGIALILVLIIVVSGRLLQERHEKTAEPVPAGAPHADRPAWTAEMQKEVDAWMFSGEPVEGGCITIQVRGGPNYINPLLSSNQPDNLADYLVFDNFLNHSRDLLPVPSEAAVIEESEDRLVYTIRLDPRGRWHDGHPVTADDILFFHDLVNDPESIAQTQLYNVANIDHLEKIDDLTLKVYMKEVIAAGMWKANLSALPKHAFEAEKEEFKRQGKNWDVRSSLLNRKPIGNGRYKLVSWEQPDTLVFERWEDYPFKKPYIKKIILKVIRMDATAFNAFKVGEVDCILDLNARSFAEGTKSPAFKAVGRKILTPGLISVSIIWNMDGTNPFFTDVRVRKALAMSVNVQAIIDTLGHGLYVRSNGIWSPTGWYYNPNVKLLPHHPDAARDLLEAAGWRDIDGDGIREKGGKDFAFEILGYSIPAAVDILTAIANDMKKVGVNATVRAFETKTFQKHLMESDFQASYFPLSMTVDPDYGYNVWHSSQVKVGRNVGKYANPRVDELFEKGRKTLDIDRRKEIYQEIQQIIYEDQAALFLYYIPIRFSVHKRIKGVEISPIGPFLFYPGLFGWWIPKDMQRCL